MIYNKQIVCKRQLHFSDESLKQLQELSADANRKIILLIIARLDNSKNNNSRHSQAR